MSESSCLLPQPRLCLAAPLWAGLACHFSLPLPSLEGTSLHTDDRADKCHSSLSGPCACHNSGHRGGIHPEQKVQPQSPGGLVM